MVLEMEIEAGTLNCMCNDRPFHSFHGIASCSDSLLCCDFQGCGFGFRYTHLRHLVPSKVQMTEFGTASLQSKYPGWYQLW